MWCLLLTHTFVLVLWLPGPAEPHPSSQTAAAAAAAAATAAAATAAAAADTGCSGSSAWPVHQTARTTGHSGCYIICHHLPACHGSILDAAEVCAGEVFSYR